MSGAGRPQGSPNRAGDQVVRLATVTVRLSEVERDFLVDAAAKKGVAVGELVRNALRGRRLIPTARSQRTGRK